MFTIGILGDANNTVLNIMESIFIKSKINHLITSENTAQGISEAFLETIKKKAKVMVINIKEEKYFSQLCTIRFDVIIYLMENIKEVQLSQLLKENNYLIINADGNIPQKISVYGETTLITCGFSKNASITVSSVDRINSNSFLFCIQRAIEVKKGRVIQPQEFNFSTYNYKDSIYESMVAVTAVLLCKAKI
ncbi:MAG: hypothetical protein ACRCW1_04465 [Anaerotignaceae bacterium]